MKNMQDLFRQSPELIDKVSPYLSKFNQLNWISIPLGSIVPQPLPGPPEAEFILIVARSGNAGTINVWNQSLGAGIGVPLAAGDSMILSEDNETWNTAEALAQILGRNNPVPRRAIRVADIYIIASVATQTADVCFGYGPQL